MYDDLIRLIEKSGVSFSRSTAGLPQSVIDKAESDLSLSLPPSFKWWLKRYGGGQIGGDVLYGLDDNGQGKPDIVKLAMQNEKKERQGRKNLVFMIGNEEQFYFDTDHPGIQGEYPVYLLDAQQGEPFLYANSFPDFLVRRIKETGGQT